MNLFIDDMANIYNKKLPLYVFVDALSMLIQSTFHQTYNLVVI